MSELGWIGRIDRHSLLNPGMIIQAKLCANFFSNVQLFFVSFLKWTNSWQIYRMHYSVYSLSVAYTLSIWPIVCIQNIPGEASLEHLNYSKTIRRPVLCSAHLGSWQHSPDPVACGKRAGHPFPKNPTPTSAVRTSGCGLSGLANPLSNYPSTSRYPPTLLVLCQHGTTSCT